jgi:hypothetical protein
LVASALLFVMLPRFFGLLSDRLFEAPDRVWSSRTAAQQTIERVDAHVQGLGCFGLAHCSSTTLDLGGCLFA